LGLAISTCIVWPLPLLHGRKPYILAALALAMPLQFPQAMIVSGKRSPTKSSFRAGLLCARAATGIVLGFANVNYFTVLLDLFGASLQSKNPHQEYVVPNDVRRHGGGMGLWLGIWSWCWIASLAVGFQIGAAIIEKLSPDWGFYIVIIILAAALVLNIAAPETRRYTSGIARRVQVAHFNRWAEILVRRGLGWPETYGHDDVPTWIPRARPVSCMDLRTGCTRHHSSWLFAVQELQVAATFRRSWRHVNCYRSLSGASSDQSWYLLS
jgi:MFS family permease